MLIFCLLPNKSFLKSCNCRNVAIPLFCFLSPHAQQSGYKINFIYAIFTPRMLLEGRKEIKNYESQD